MSTSIVTAALNYALSINNWKIYALHHEHGATDKYQCCDMQLHPTALLSDYMHDTINAYINLKLPNIQDVVPYNGFGDACSIQKIDSTSELVQTNYDNLLLGITTSLDASQIKHFDANAFIISGSCTINGNLEHLIFITLRSPFRPLKKVLRLVDNAFIRNEEKFLYLSERIDVLIINNTLYMLTNGLESLFNLERSYKIKCSNDVQTICACSILSDSSSFSTFATTGYNPRKFVGFKPQNLEYLKTRRNRMTVSNTFGIDLDPSGLFVSDDAENVERLVKFLCGKAKQDPVDQAPCEVPYSKAWN